MFRNRFESQLDTLNVEMIKMGALCEEAINMSVKAFIEHDQEAVKTVFEKEDEINRKEKEIENLGMRMLLQQQPVAKDLRAISSVLKMIADMERIGDQAANIADIATHSVDNKLQSKVHIKDMTVATVKMVTDSVDSFVKKDLDFAREVMKYDDVLDALFKKVRSELITIIGDSKADGEQCIDLLMVAKYLERIGDHATNIAEWVEYSITGEHPKVKNIEIEDLDA